MFAIQGSPKIIMERDVIIVNETDTIDLICESFNSLPMTNFNWINENENSYQIIVEKDDRKDVFKTILRIDIIDESDNGSFECYLKNDAGEDRKAIELLVQTAPQIDTIQIKANEIENRVESNAIVVENDSITIDCIVDGFPSPKITWYKDQEELFSNRNESSLIFPNILENDTGQYQCLATNILGIASKNFHMRVNVPPKAQSSKENMLKVLEGDEVTIHCKIYGNPPPTISWFENDKPFDNVSQDQKILTFEALLTKSGIYSCLGVNDLGSVLINFTVLVLGKLM